jgi:hypothetical protein
MKRLAVLFAIVACGLVAAFANWYLSYVDVVFVIPKDWHGGFQVILDPARVTNVERNGLRVVKMSVDKQGEARVPSRAYVARQSSVVAYFDDGAIVPQDQLHFIGCYYDSMVGHDTWWWYVGNEKDAESMQAVTEWRVGNVDRE